MPVEYLAEYMVEYLVEHLIKYLEKHLVEHLVKYLMNIWKMRMICCASRIFGPHPHTCPVPPNLECGAEKCKYP